MSKCWGEVIKQQGDFFLATALAKGQEWACVPEWVLPPRGPGVGSYCSQSLGTKGPETEATDTFGTLGSQAKPSPSTTSSPRQELLSKHHKYTSCSGLEQSPQPTVRTQELYELPHCETLIPHTDVPGDPAPSGARCAEHHVERSGKALKKVSNKTKEMSRKELPGQDLYTRY